jgi:hypothetical protein
VNRLGAERVSKADQQGPSVVLNTTKSLLRDTFWCPVA